MSSRISVRQILFYLLIPAYLLSGGYGPFKCIFVFPLVIFLILLIALFVKKRFIKKILSNNNIFFIVLAILSVVSILGGANLRSYLEVFEIIVGLTVILLLNEYITDRRSVSTIMTVIKVVVILSAMHAIVQYIIGERVTGPYSNENRLATLYVFVAPFFLAEMCKKITIFNIIVLSLIFLVSILAGSRFCQLCLLIAFFLTAIEMIRLSNIKQKKGIILFSIIVAIFLAPIVGSIIASERGKSLTEQSQSKGGSFALRVYLISEGIRLFKESNYMGVGAGNVYTVSYWDDGDESEGSLHNFVISLLATYGLLGFIFFAYMYIFLIKDYRNLKSRSYDQEYVFALKIFLIIFILASNSPSSLFQFRPFYFIFGFYFSILNIYKKELIR